MNLTIIKWRSGNFLLVVLILQLAVYATIFFDIPIARQIAGLFYFTFIPGFIVVRLLRMKELSRLETVLFSIGFSLAFLMIAGFMVNIFGLAFGLSKPLSLLPLIIILSIVILAGAIKTCLSKESVKLLGEISTPLPMAILIVSLPVFGIIGAIWITTQGNNSIPFALILIIPLVLVVGIVSKKILPSKVYPLAVISIALLLLYQSSFISRYLVPFGSDIANEFFVSKFTQNNAFWNPAYVFPGNEAYGRLYSMFSVTILPAVYSTLLNMDVTWVFKLLYPMIFSLVPLGLYQLWQSMLGKKRALIAAFLFMAQSTFYTEMLGLARQMIAELFFVLLLITISNKKIKPLNGVICFGVFSIALVTSHYALAEMFLFFISVALIYLIVSKRKSRRISALSVVFFFVMMFSWYIYTSGAATFNSFMSFGNYIYGQLGNFLSPRNPDVWRGIGFEPPPTIWNLISRAFAYVTEALIVFGIVGLVTRRVDNPFEREYSIITLTAFAFLMALIIVPGLANTLNMTRFYHILLFFLAPLCVLGADFLVQLVSKRRMKIGTSILLLIILVPYFLFQTGFFYEVAGIQSYSLPLSKHRMDASFLRWNIGYFDDSEVTGALWMSGNANINGSKIYADASSATGLLVGYIYTGNIEILSDATVILQDSFIYLNRANLDENRAIGPNYMWNTTSISKTLESANQVYSNGGCEIYKKTAGS